MANTTNYSWNLPTVGGNQDAWGDLLNANWTALDTLLGGTSAAEFAILDGATVTTAELNYVSGVTSNIQAQINSAGVPSGAILLWSGSTASIPSGWYLCNGSNGTPDLRDRFVVGAGGGYSVGATGGASTVALSTANMPAHTHTFSGTTSSSGSHKHGSGTLSNYSNTNGTYGSGSSLGAHQGIGSGSQIATTTDGAHTHTYSGTTSSAGSGSAHENRPPYYALAYIMKA